MARRVQLKDDHSEKRIIRRRIVLSALIILFLLGLVLARLYELQVVGYQHFTTLSDSNRIRIRALPPARGLIIDRNGEVLANNLPSYRLEIIREQVDDLDDTLSRLKQYVDYSEQDLTRFKRASQRRRPFESVPLRLNLNDQEVASLAVNLHEFDGVQINARLTRNYPKGAHAVHALGYVGRIDERDLARVDETNYAGTTHIGKLGLERYYEDELHGLVGVQHVEVNAKGRTLRVLEETPPVQGKNLYLSIDSRLQMVAERAFGDYTGAAIAIDPTNGEVLALVSVPTFDPNQFVNGISYERYNELRDSRRRPLFNRALSGQYPPGSTTKPFFGLAGLELSVFNRNKTVNCPGFYQLPNEERLYRDWKREGHGLMDLNEAVAQSCDVYFYELSYAMGIDRMSAFMNEFGFGRKTRIDSTGERGGLLPSREWKESSRGIPWFPGETLITGIGQGAFLATPLQLAVSTAAFSQKGIRYQPRLVRSLAQVYSYEHEEKPAVVSGQYEVRSPNNWQHVHRSMVNVVHGLRGTAQGIRSGLQYKIAGKTGTAQVVSIPQDDEDWDEEELERAYRDHALFVSYAPAEEPKIAVAVIVENGVSGSAVAAPIARKIMDAYLLRDS